MLSQFKKKSFCSDLDQRHLFKSVCPINKKKSDRAMRKHVFGHMRTAKAQSASAQSDQDLHCPLIESLGTEQYNEE